MATCFVIQPFDNGGKFDKRYADIFEPAIRDAGLDPYRVDNDPAVTIPIDDIENGIRRASICLADISLNNPNVWFELGYALASNKQICLLLIGRRGLKSIHLMYSIAQSQSIDLIRKLNSNYLNQK